MEGGTQGKPTRLLVATVASALLYAAAHPPWSLWPLALLATAPVSAVLLDPRTRTGGPRAAGAGFLFGVLATMFLVGHWSWLAAGEFFPGSSWQAVAFTAALPLLASGIALHYAVVFVLVSRLAGFGAVAGVVGSAALWSAGELARTSLGAGNPWAVFAAALTGADAWMSGFRAVTPVADLLALGGAPAVAMPAAGAGAAIGLAWALRRSVVARGQALATGAVLVLAFALMSMASGEFAPRRGQGAARLEQSAARLEEGAARLEEGTAPKQPLRVALVQPGVGRSRLWQSGGAAESLERHLQATRSVDTRGADLIVWPENSLPFLMDANADRKDVLRGLARERGAALLVGGSRSAKAEGGRTLVFNSAFLFPADGGEPEVYDKRVLLPYVEHVPDWVAPFLASPWQGAYAPGTGPGLFTVKGWRIAPLLCLEAIYPGESASRVADGADLLVNLSNDSWFDDGAGPQQDFALALLRAAETRRPMVRVATTGVSALVGQDGLVAWSLPPKTGAVALLDVPPAQYDSLFVRGGGAGFVLVVLAIATAAALLPAWAARRTRSEGVKR